MGSIYDMGLEKNDANYVPLSPLSFLKRSAMVCPNRVSIIQDNVQYTWSQTYERVKRCASALIKHGVGKHDTVACMLPNVAAMYEAHFAVPMAGAVINTLNTRLDPEAIAFQLQHGEAKVILTDLEFSATIKKALALLPGKKPLVIDVMDPEFNDGERLGSIDYEQLLAQGNPDFSWELPQDEWDPIALNYTSGTTGNPKGVVYHHRGAYLNAISNVVSWGMPPHVVYLWTLPMFHCNGWCFPWTMAVNSGVSVCLRRVDPRKIFELIIQHHITHMCGAPIVYGMLIGAPESYRADLKHKIYGLIAGAAPPAAILEGCDKIGFDLTHVYGLTETYGPASVCAKHPEWDAMSMEERAVMNGRQGVSNHLQESITVLDPETMKPVPWDGETIGEIMFRGNVVMKGYLKNPEASQESFAGGWFHTGDLAVVHKDGYVKIKDRSKDVIISGGENISSIEVEEVLFKHPAVSLAAVVAKPDPKWGEVPCAYVELKADAKATEAEIIEYCKQHLARFKVPKQIVFVELPKTSTGKIQKFKLREFAKSASAIE